MLFCKTRQNMTVHTVEAGLRFNFKQLHCQTTALPRLVNSIVHLPPTNVNSLEMCSHVLLANQRDHWPKMEVKIEIRENLLSWHQPGLQTDCTTIQHVDETKSSSLNGGRFQLPWHLGENHCIKGDGRESVCACLYALCISVFLQVCLDVQLRCSVQHL